MAFALKLVIMTLLSNYVDCFEIEDYKFGSIDAIPRIFYGTAWKKEKTAGLVVDALASGFTAIDTACQPKHYSESGVGDGIKIAVDKGFVSRKDLFIQTKFTPFPGQDPNRLPYDRDAPLIEQIKQSFSVSLNNLHVDYIDSVVLHSPLDTLELTMEAWRQLEIFHGEGRIKYLGISNIYNVEHLQYIYEHSVIKPTFVQNRFYKRSGFDNEIREFCNTHGMKYQGFWTLTANRKAIARYVL